MKTAATTTDYPSIPSIPVLDNREVLRRLGIPDEEPVCLLSPERIAEQEAWFERIRPKTPEEARVVFQQYHEELMRRDQ